MATFSISEAESPLPLQPGASPRSLDASNCRDWEEVSCALLEDGFILTALELHTELLECGREVSTLKDYFSNPGNFEHAIPQPPSSSDLLFRTSSLSTFDSIELGRYSDDGNKETDDRVAVLEFELRKAFETIKSLRGSLTKATEVVPAKEGEVAIKTMAKSSDPIMPHEKRALNFLVHEYLMQRDNKLTAITFTEENGDQDFDDWDDVGLNIPKPPDLLYLFRNYSTCTLSDKEKIDRIKQLEDQLSQLTGENLALKRENEALHLKLKRVRSSVSDEGSHKKTHRRGSSLTETQAVSNTITELKRQERTRTHSSPEADLKKIAAVLKEKEAVGGSKQAKPVSERSKVNEQTSSESDGVSDEKRRSTISSTSVISTQSDVTLSADDDVETVVDEGEKMKDWEEKEQGNVLTREQSISSTTLQNDKQEEEEEGEGERGEVKRMHQMSVTFRQELLNIFHLKTDSRIGLEVSKLTDPNLDPVQLLGRCLPHIVPNVILAKREELIPILLCVISKHPDARTRDQLLHMMFNLIKRPDRKQRHVIMSGCVAFAKLSGTTRVESELLPQMWEQITHKYFERRLLVAESCGVLAPYIPAELRGSLVLSMLKQMLMEDKAESVRQAVARSLAIIVAFTDDEDKFKLCWELMLTALTDHSQLVVSTTYSVLLPALAAWSFELNTLESDILSYFLHQLLTCIKQVSRSEGESGAVEQSQHHLLTLTHLVSWHYATILLSGPYVDNMTIDPEGLKEPSFPHPSSSLLDIHVIVGDDAKLTTLVEMFELELTSKSFSPWKSLQWFKDEYLEKLLRASVVLGFSQSELIHSLSYLLSAYCNYFGHTFTHKVIKPFFEKQLLLPKHNPGAAIAEGHTHLTTPVLPIYVSGVLASFDKDERLLVNYLRCTIVDMALYFAPLDSLRVTFMELRRERKYHALLLGLLQDLVTHSSFQVRRCIAILFGLMIRNVDEKQVRKVVLPELVKLAKDSEMSVRIDTIASFGTIMETVTSKEVLVRAHEQFEAFMDSEQFRADHQVLMAVLKTLAKIGPHADPVFRDEFIIARLAEVAVENSKADNLTKKKDIALALLEAYRNISECFISTELLTTYMLPGLNSVLRDMEALDAGKVPAVQQLIRNCQSKVEEYQKQATGGSGDSKPSTFFSKLKPPFDRDLPLSPSKLFRKKL